MKFVPLHLVTPLKNGETIATKLAPRYPDCIAWVIAVRNSHTINYDTPWEYFVRYFEVPADLIAGEYDVVDEQLEHDEQYEVNTLEEVDEIMGRLVGDPSVLKLLSDYPDYFPF